MKKEIAMVSLMMLVLISGSALAQNNTFRAEVPFAFTLGNQELPAGSYQFERLLGKPGTSDAVGMVAIRNSEMHLYKVIVTNLSDDTAEKQSSSKLVFSRSGGRHCLEQMWIAGDTRRQVLPQRVREQEYVADSSRDEVAMAQLR